MRTQIGLLPRLAGGFLALLPFASASWGQDAVVSGLGSTVHVYYADGATEGFNDATVGAQRKAAFEYAVLQWADVVVSSVPIAIEAEFNPMSPCSAGGGILGRAGFNTAHMDWVVGTPPPFASTWYPQPLANAFAGVDLSPSQDDIGAEFNSSVGNPTCFNGVNWYYGTDGNTPPGDIDFVTVALHEIAHGLGFVALVNLSTGAKLNGFDDVYTRNLEDHSLATLWPALTNGQRAASAKDDGDLLWVGSNVVAGSTGLAAGRHPSGGVQMYAPTSLQTGSSVSHFDTDVTPDQLMEPFLSGTLHNLDLTADLFADLGWQVLTKCGNNNLDPGEDCDDGDLDDGDGCDSNCTVTGCGNGITTAGEACDDGNASNTDACKTDCTLNVCGDGFTHTGVEQCDDGDLDSGDGCDANCTVTGCGNGITTAGEECDDGNGNNSDGCTNACTHCGNNVVTPPEQCDDGNLINTDDCQANCQNRGQLPPVDYSPVGGLKDFRSVFCQKQVGSAVSTVRNKKYTLMRNCLDAIQEYKARVLAGASASDIQRALDAVTRACDAFRPTDPDEKTMLGKIALERDKAVSAIEKKCGVPGQQALDGKTIGTLGSSDFDRMEIETHVDRAGCVAEQVVSAGYPSAVSDLNGFDSRPSQGGDPLDTYFPCLDLADFPAVDYSPVNGKKDRLSVSCQKKVGFTVTLYRNRKYFLMRACVDAIQEHKARIAANASPADLQRAIDAITRNCIEARPSDPDERTMLGKLEAARTKAISDIEKSCGTPGNMTIDGKVISVYLASGDFTQAEIAQHVDNVSCTIESIVSAGYNGIKSDLAQYNARPSQGGDPLDTYFPCLE
jgi:cysteine-rich repeat protein